MVQKNQNNGQLLHYILIIIQLMGYGDHQGKRGGIQVIKNQLIEMGQGYYRGGDELCH